IPVARTTSVLGTVRAVRYNTALWCTEYIRYKED
ncbi:MAG: hypothetical protein RLY87_2535, partial [Chloroflexota bacterium]